MGLPSASRTSVSAAGGIGDGIGLPSAMRVSPVAPGRIGEGMGLPSATRICVPAAGRIGDGMGLPSDMRKLAGAAELPSGWLTERITGSRIKHANVANEAKNTWNFFMDVAILLHTLIFAMRGV